MHVTPGLREAIGVDSALVASRLLAWHRWTRWHADDPGRRTQLLDTTEQPVTESVDQVERWMTWQRDAHQAGRLALSRGWALPGKSQTPTSTLCLRCSVRRDTAEAEVRRKLPRGSTYSSPSTPSDEKRPRTPYKRPAPPSFHTDDQRRKAQQSGSGPVQEGEALIHFLDRCTKTSAEILAFSYFPVMPRR